MKVKICCLILICSLSNVAFANAIIEKTYSQNSSIVRPTSIVYSNVDSENNEETYNNAIKEIQKKLKQNPNDYFLNAALSDLYIKTNKYDKAYSELIFLNNLAKQNKLNLSTKNLINTIYENYRKTVKYDKNKSLLYVNLSVMALILGYNEQAENCLVLAAYSTNNLEMVKKTLNVVLSSVSNTEAILITLDKIISKHPNDIEIRELFADYLVQNKDIDYAIEQYIQILELKPNDITTKYKLYKLLVSKRLSQKEIIKTLYNTDKPDMEIVYSELCEMLLQNNELSEAKTYAKLLTEKYPNNANGFITLSEIYRREGKIKDSYEILNQARDKADNNEQIAKYNVILAKLSDEPLREANSLIMTGLYAQALEVLESANPEDLYVILAQARANYYLSKKKIALDLLNKAMTIYPNNSDVYCAFGYIYLQEKNIDNSRKYVNQSLKINPNNRTALDLLDLVNKAETDKKINQIVSNYESENYTETMRLIEEALKINQKDSRLYYYKALTYIAQNNYAASTALLYKTLELDRGNILAYFYLGIAFDNLSEPENALMYYKKFISLLPEDDYGESEQLNYAKTRIEKLKNYR
jgi:tetratricopeptide (TPR) repeat protein